MSVGSRLFHTLDPTTRGYEHEGRRYLVTDTVGFIRKLPHQLVEAFKATLEETRLADLIIHVVDASEPEERRAGAIVAVDEVLDEIGAGERPRLLVYNKIDLLPEEERARLLVGRRDVVGVSAETGEGIDQLRDRIAMEFERTLEPLELLLPYSEGARLGELHELAGDLERSDRAEGVLVRGRVPAALAHRFTEFAVNGAGDGSAPADAALRSGRGAPLPPPDRGSDTSDAHPRRRRRPRPLRRRGRHARARRSCERRHRGRGRDPRGACRPGPAALRPRGASRDRVVNAPGLIDAGYRGEVRVLLLNTDPREAFEIAPGDRIAQLLITPFAAAEPAEAVELSVSERGNGGFGSSGR